MIVQLTPFILLDGNAQEAIEFYETALEAKIIFKQTYGEGPQNPDHPIPDNAKDRLAHSVLKMGETELYAADIYPGQPYQRGDQLNICITITEIEKSKKIYEALQQGGQINMPLQEVHFSPLYGVVTDKFGVTFQIFTKKL